MQVKVFCYGKCDTVKIFHDMKKAKIYLNRKKKEGFTLLKEGFIFNKSVPIYFSPVSGCLIVHIEKYN